MYGIPPCKIWIQIGNQSMNNKNRFTILTNPVVCKFIAGEWRLLLDDESLS
jgi:hypothetical protein